METNNNQEHNKEKEEQVVIADKDELERVAKKILQEHKKAFDALAKAE